MGRQQVPGVSLSLASQPNICCHTGLFTWLWVKPRLPCKHFPESSRPRPPDARTIDLTAAPTDFNTSFLSCLTWMLRTQLPPHCTSVPVQLSPMTSDSGWLKSTHVISMDREGTLHINSRLRKWPGRALKARTSEIQYSHSLGVMEHRF